MRIFLIGLPGSGKTTLGREMGELLHIGFVDLDEEIIRKQKISIREIFEAQGESHFRKFEQEELHNLTNSIDQFVMATGGGVPAHFDNMQFMKEHGTTVFLNPPIESLEQRLAAMPLEERPLFANTSSIAARLRQLLEDRISFYSQADLEVNYEISASELIALLTRK